MLMILALARRIEDEPLGKRPRIDVLGIVLSAAGLGLAVFGVLRSSVWGWVNPKPDAPELFGISAVMWLILGGLFLLWLFFEWEQRLEQGGTEPLVRPSMLRNVQMVGGLRMFFFQYFVQSGVFFVVPLFLSVSLRLSAIDTGVRLLPLSLAAPRGRGDPALSSQRQPRRVVRLALLAMFAGTVVLLAASTGCLGQGRHAPAAAARPASARWRLLARHRVGRARLSPSRRPAEHRDEHRRVTGNRAGRVGPHRSLREPRRRHPGEPGRATRGSPQGRRRALQRRAVPLRRRRRSRLEDAGVTGETASAIVEENARAWLDAPARLAGGHRGSRGSGAVLHRARPDATTRRRGRRDARVTRPRRGEGSALTI